MKVTSIVKQKRNDERYNIYIDNEFSFSANMEDILKYSIKEGMELDTDEVNNLIEQCEASKAYSYALNLLSKRDYTSAEVEKKLANKGFSINTIMRVLNKLKLYAIINDERYIKKYVKDSQNFKKYGIRKIRYILESKGIDKEALDSINEDEEIELENAYSLAIKKLKLLGDKANQKEKIYRYLISRGYNYDVISKTINRIYKDGENEYL